MGAMVKIRLSRKGAKKNPYYWIVAVEKDAKRDGVYLERLGQFHPRSKDPKDRLNINVEAIKVWQSKGAQVTDSVGQLLKSIPQ